MRKPWEETGSHRERFLGDDRPRRFDRRMDERDGFGRSDRNDFPRRSDRRSDRRDDRYERRDNRFDARGGDRKRFNRRPESRLTQTDFFGVRSGPRARAAMAGRMSGNRAYVGNPSRNALITLDADVARVFGSSQAVNEALRHLIALAKIMGPAAFEQAQNEVEPQTQEDENELAAVEEESQKPAQAETDPVEGFPTVEEDDEEWFEIPTEPTKEA